MATYRGEDQTAQLFIWLRLHGANPDEIPLDADMTISTDENGVKWLHWSQFALVNGGRYMNPWNTGAAIEKHAARLLAPPPDWWEPIVHPTREQLAEQLRAVYRERAQLVAYVAALHPSVMAEDPDEPGWLVCYIETRSGQWSWHIAPEDLDLFAHVPHGQATWDGHTTEEKYRRIRQHTQTVAAATRTEPAEQPREAPCSTSSAT